MIITEEGNMDEEKKVVPAGKLFSEDKLLLGAIFGGPFVASYILYRNFRTLNEHKKAAAVIIIIAFVTIWAFWAGMRGINIPIPMAVLPFLYTGIAWGIMKKYQAERIKEHINNGGELIGWKKLLTIIILGYIILSAPFFLTILILASYF
jgi:hypothetical protein